MKISDCVSAEFEPYMGCNHLTHEGFIFRPIIFKEKDKDDLYFEKYVHDKYGLTLREKFTGYDLAVPNRHACMPSIIKYNKPPVNIVEEYWQVAEQWCLKHFSAAGGSLELEPSEDVFRLMDLKTSPGFPFNLLPGCSSKRKIIEIQELKDVCYEYNRLIEFEQLPVLWAVHEKEEIRSFKKLIINKLRTFVGAPLDFLYSCMCMFHDMNEKLYASAANHENWSFVGATKYFGGFNRLFERLNKHPNAFELDETDYDCSLQERFLNSACEMRIKFLNNATVGQQDKIRNLYKEIIHSFMVLPFGDVLRKFSGNPSGSFNTITDNTLVLYELLVYAWHVLVPEKYKTYELFHKHVEAVLCGDDNTWSVSNELLPYFNAERVCLVWSNIGVTTHTDSLKPRKVIECSFMSSHFVPYSLYQNQDYVFPAPKFEKVMASMSFNLKFCNAKWSLLRACALRIDSFFCFEAREMLMDYIRWFLKEYREELELPCDPHNPKDFLSFSDVLSVYKTDDELMHLYLGDCESIYLNENVILALEEMELGYIKNVAQ